MRIERDLPMPIRVICGHMFLQDAGVAARETAGAGAGRYERLHGPLRNTRDHLASAGLVAGGRALSRCVPGGMDASDSPMRVANQWRSILRRIRKK